MFGAKPTTDAIAKDRATPVRVAYRPTMSLRARLLFGPLLLLALALTVRYALWWFGSDRIPHNRLPLPGSPWWFVPGINVALFVALTLVEWGRVLGSMVLWFFAARMRDPVPLTPVPGLRVAILTAIVPSKEPLNILEHTLAAMRRIRYDGAVDCWILDEEGDPRVRETALRLGGHYFTRHGVERYNQPSGAFKARCKGGNFNAWRDAHEAGYDLVAELDLDHVPSEDFLAKTIGYFRDPEVGFVVMPQVYGNTDESPIAQGANEQQWGFYGVMQRGANGWGMPLLIGSNHAYRPAALRSVGGYSGHIVEDHLTGLRIYATRNPLTGRRWRGVYVPEVVTVGEGPTTWGAYFAQQMRWAYGLNDILFRHAVPLWRRLRPGQVVGYLLLEIFYAQVAITYAVGVLLTVLYLGFGVSAARMSLGGWLGVWLPQIAVSLALHYWLQIYHLRPQDRGWQLRGMAQHCAALPIYVMALLQVALGRRLAYAVTPKGSGAAAGEEVGRVFRPHILWASASFVALAVSVIFEHNAPQLRFWALLNIALMLLAVASANRLNGANHRRSDGRRGQSPRLAASIAGCIAAGVLLVAGVAVQSVYSHPTAVPIAPASPPVAAHRLSFPLLAGRSVMYGLFEDSGQPSTTGNLGEAFLQWQQPPGEIATAAATIAASGRLPLIAWEPRAGPILAQPNPSDAELLGRIANGQEDSYIRSVAEAVRKGGTPVIIRFAAEMELPASGLHPWAGQDPVLYIAAYRRVVDLFRNAGAENVRWLWSPAGATDANGNLAGAAYYPGDAYVDYTGFSAFLFTPWMNPNILSKGVYTPDDLLGARLTELAQRYAKPIIIPEMGVAPEPTLVGNRAGWLTEAWTAIAVTHKYPNLVGVIYEDIKDDQASGDPDWRLSASERGIMVRVFDPPPSPRALSKVVRTP